MFWCLLSVRNRLDQPSFLVFEKLESLLIKSLKGEEISDEVEFVKEKYGIDIDMNDLLVENIQGFDEEQADWTLLRFAERDESEHVRKRRKNTLFSLMFASCVEF